MPRRLDPITPDHMDEGQRALYATMLSGPRASGRQSQALTEADGSLVGPFNSMLLSPPIGNAVQGLGAALRFETRLTDRERELAILLVAHRWQSPFERTAHEAIARKVGVSDDEIECLSRGETPSLDDDGERAVVALTRELVETWNVTDASYARAVDALGTARVYELTTIVGHYSLLALHLRVFNGESGPPAPHRRSWWSTDLTAEQAASPGVDEGVDVEEQPLVGAGRAVEPGGVVEADHPGRGAVEL
jgi:4-carboxymuconolactone decarboxylase